MRWIFVSILFLGISTSYAQSCDQVYIHGRVVDTMQSQNAFYNMMVINTSTGRGVFGSPNGSFSNYCRANDSITISVKGYYTMGFRVKPDADCQMNFSGILEPEYKTLAKVVIKPLKSLQQIKEEREALAMRETKTVTGVNVLESPITALYEAFSKKEKAKRWLAEQKYKDSQREVLKDLLRLYNLYDIVKLPEDEFDQFIDFLNVDANFLKTASEIELVTFIKDKFEHYQAVKKEIPR
jgi:hypothetical protein